MDKQCWENNGKSPSSTLAKKLLLQQQSSAKSMGHQNQKNVLILVSLSSQTHYAFPIPWIGLQVKKGIEYVAVHGAF